MAVTRIKGRRSANGAQRLCQLKKVRAATAAPRNRGIEKRSPGEAACGRIVPQPAQLSIHTPSPPLSAVGSTKPRIAPNARAVTHFISGEHSQRVFDEPLERLHQLGAVRSVDGSVVEASGGAHDCRDLERVVD